MLYLTRKTGEAVMVGDSMRVTVECIEPKQVRVRIYVADAPTVITLVPGKPYLLRDNCAVTLRSTRAGQCGLGFKAPRNVPIHRQEVYDRIAEAHA